jgi:hypothetical protein
VGRSPQGGDEEAQRSDDERSARSTPTFHHATVADTAALEATNGWAYTVVVAGESSRGRDVVTDTLGSDCTGVLISDCLARYEKVPWLMGRIRWETRRVRAEPWAELWVLSAAPKELLSS